MKQSEETMLTPKKIVQELSKYVIGQEEAKKAVAIALRNRWRRAQLTEDLRKEITPKNILMIGPTGVGKTEIARRLAFLADAPFVKVEATKFTEVGYVGRDVDSIIRDLVEVAVKQVRETEMEKVREKAWHLAKERVLDVLLPKGEGSGGFSGEPKEKESSDSVARKLFRKKLDDGELDDKEIDVQISGIPVGLEIMTPPGMEEMAGQLQNMFSNLSKDRKKTKKLKIAKALKVISEEEAAKMINEDDLRSYALERVEQHGIVFIDEIDKIVRYADSNGAAVSREGVQRDLLPLVEGCSVSTKYGIVKTDHILFIASGAFHLSKPSDLIPELQGRLPIRVELRALKVEDFVKILTEPEASLTKQYIALMGTEKLNLKFTKDGVKRIAEVTYHVNETTENIGARRLYTILERLLEEISFSADEQKSKNITINVSYVDKQLSSLVGSEDLSHYIL